MDKVTALVELKERINTVGFNQYQYIEVNDDGKRCFCSVGHLMDICGVDFTPFEERSDLNGETVPLALIHLQPLVDIGFHLDELSEIQNLNDNDGSTASLNTYIDKLIAENEGGKTNE